MTQHLYKLFLRGLVVIVLVPIFLLLVRAIQLSRLPLDEVSLPPIGEDALLEIPPRPGVEGIIISGPKIDPLIFSIDLERTGIVSLDWQQLQLVDPNAVITINADVDERGQIHFSQSDVDMAGHPEAGILIQDAVRTWMFKPYKTGRIQFWFNLPSKGRKLVIDTQGLRRRSSIPDHVLVYDGRLYLVDGISSNEVQVN